MQIFMTLSLNHPNRVLISGTWACVAVNKAILTKLLQVSNALACRGNNTPCSVSPGISHLSEVGSTSQYSMSQKTSV